MTTTITVTESGTTLELTSTEVQTVEIVAEGPEGRGVPVGGSDGQFLVKDGVIDFDARWHTLTKADVALDQVDNTSDLNKPISTATQAALDSAAATTQAGLDTKEPTIAAGTIAQFWRGDKTWADLFTQVRAATLTGLSTAAGTIVDATHTVLQAIGFLQKQVSDNKASADAHIARTDNPHTVTKAQVGLGSVDNTSDADKPVSTAQQTALNLKADQTSLTAHTGDTANPHAVTKAQVGLSNVDNTSDANKPVSTAQQTALDGKEPTIAAGTASQYWSGTKTWQTLDKAAVGLSNVDNTSDASKPISTATQTALDLKANAADANLTGTANAQNLLIASLLGIPVWTTAGRPVTANVAIGYNTDLLNFEGYNGSEWTSIGGGGATGAPGNSVFYENEQVVTGSYTITSGTNAMSAGPITINDGVAVTIPNGSVWTVV